MDDDFTARLTETSTSSRSTPRVAKPVLIVILLIGTLLEGCICETSGVNRGDVNLVSRDQEWQLGEELASEIIQQAEIVDDSAVQKYIEQMGGRIVAVSELSDRPWRFHVVRDSTVNAFNIPGGHVFINTGLILAAETPSELAGVVAHEVAHGVARHSTERMTKAYGLNLIIGLVAGERVTMLEQIAAQLLGAGAMAKFSRDDEREADRLGLDYVADAEYAPDGMAAMFETMLRLRARRPNMVEQFFSTHPLTEERIAEMEARASALEHPGDEANVDAFRRIQDRIDGSW